MSSPWEQFEIALHLPREQRATALHAVLDSLNSVSHGEAHHVAELRAAAFAQLASLDDRYLDEARVAVTAAESVGSAGWANYYLGAALLFWGKNDEALVQLSRVPLGFFEAQDLSWRAVHVDEMTAIARLELGQLREAAALVDQVSAALANRGDEDDLAPPVDLVEALLRHASGPDGDAVRTMLAVLATSVDFATWIGPELASKVADALESSTDSP